MSENLMTPAEYMIQTQKWREHYHIAVNERSKELKQANEVVSGLDRAANAEFFSDAAAWGARETAKAAGQFVPYDLPNFSPRAAPDTDRVKEQLRNIQAGKYLMLWGYFGGSINQTIQQGVLQSVDWDNGTVLLHSTTYGHDLTVDLNKISHIDESRSGSGALSAAQEGDWIEAAVGEWYKDGKKYGDKDA